ncbi:MULTISPECIES: fused DSP-PTPase phosphatase/NAD kinase-like protein [Clostridium]|uniref:phosphatase domain-containing putative toxin n=1 Tax=Clostridium TaxID=1485 RepID=UPI000A440397|nr:MULTISPECIES: protein tyrosine phosphatase [Clostridium]
MKSKNLTLVLVLSIVVLLISGCNSNVAKKQKIKSSMYSKGVKLVVDNDNKIALPKNYRSTSTKINKQTSINLNGLSTMNMSGSGAVSQNSLKLIKENIGKYPTIDVDLREESHLFVNGIGVSWYGKKDDENINLTQDQVVNDEKNKLNTIKASKELKINSKSKKSVGNISKINDIKNVQTEEQLAKSLGIGYVRFAVPDHKRPQDVEVDSFISFIKKLPSGTWLNFHCRGGVGRTTTFMAMYDMMKNAKNVSFNDIMKRQQLIGGANLLSGQDASSASDAKTRSKFLKDFYNYCYENNDNFNTTWSQWIKTHK